MSLLCRLVVFSSLIVIARAASWAQASGQTGAKGGGAGASGGSPATSPASAGAASSNAPFESVMLSYGALAQTMQALAHRTCFESQRAAGEEQPPLIVIVDQASLTNLAAYDAFDRTARFLQVAFGSMIPAPFSTILTAPLPVGTNSITVAPGFTFRDGDLIQIDSEQMQIVGGSGTTWTVTRTAPSAHLNFATVVDLTALTRPAPAVAEPALAGAGGDTFSDITNAVAAVLVAGNAETGSTITIQDASAAIQLAAYLNGDSACQATDAEVVYPGIYGTATDLGDFEDTLRKVAEARRNALAAVAVIPLPAAGNQAPERLTAFNNVDATYNQFIASWFAINSATGQSGLTSIVQGFGLRKRLTVAPPPARSRQIYAVYVNVAAAGGTLQDRKNAISALTTGDWIRYSGGVVVNAMIFRKTGMQTVLYSDVLRYRSPLTHIKAPLGKHTTHYGDDLGDVCPQIKEGDSQALKDRINACATALSAQGR
jgi:hypothetical protein